jgi:hypothetical protein
LVISTVLPAREVSTSLGRYEVPEGMFSHAPMKACTGKGGLRAAITFMAPSTAAEPAMSVFISTMESVGLSDRPPESKVMALPTSATGGSFACRAFFGVYSTWMSFGSCTLPCATPRNIPIFSRSISLRPTTVAFRPPSRAMSCAARARLSGWMTLGGSLTRSLAQLVASATR